MAGKWLKHWQVPSSNDPSRFYTVAQSATGDFGCDCPVWKYRRQECKHIKRVKRDLAGSASSAPAPTSNEPRSLREARRLLAQFAMSALRPEDLLAVDFLGDLRGLTGLEATFRQGVVVVDFARPTRSWQVADLDSLAPLAGATCSRASRGRLAAGLARWAAEVTVACEAVA